MRFQNRNWLRIQKPLSEARKANNCLLFGDAGTGKSSSIKGILNKYYDEGLRIIEVYQTSVCRSEPDHRTDQRP